MSEEKSPREQDIADEIKEYKQPALMSCLLIVGMLTVMILIVLGVGGMLGLIQMVSGLLGAK